MGVQTSLALQDRLTGPLMKMMRAMDKTISAMEKMDSTTQQLDTRTLSSARRSLDSASAEFNRLATAAEQASNSTQQANNTQNGFNNSVSNAIPKLGALTAGILAAVGAYKAFDMAKGFLGDIIQRGFAFEVLKQQSEAAFTTFLGDAELAKGYMDDIYQFALTTPFQFPDLLDASRNLIAFGIDAENTLPIMQAIGDAVGGIGGGSDEMMRIADIFGVIQSQGRITAQEVNRLASMGINAYEMLGKAAGVSATEMKSQISKGAVGSAEAITGLVHGMENQFGGAMANIKGTIAGSIDSFKASMRTAGHGLIDELIAPFTEGIGHITDKIRLIPQYLAPAVSAVKPVIDLLNEAFQEGRFDGFFNTLANSINYTVTLIMWMAEGFIWFATVIDDYWPAILTGFTLLGVALIPMIISGLWSLAGAALAAWGAVLWPIFLIIAAIGAVIGVLMLFGISAQQILGAVMGFFFALGAYIYNIIASMRNLFITFAEFMVNVWIDPVYAIKKLFYDFAKDGIEKMVALAGGFDKAADVLAKVFVSAANIAIGAINGLIRALNMIPGVNIGEVSKFGGGTSGIVSGALKNFANNLDAPTSSKNVVDFSGAKMSYKNMPGAFQSGYAMGQNMKMPTASASNFEVPSLGDLMAGAIDGLGGGKSAPGGAGKGKNPTGGRLDSVGKIEKDVNIADEDLKTLLELADIKSIKNFKSLNPSFTFTGDMNVREEADIDKIVTKITEKWEDDANASTEGVYT